jgi:organic hydroperoxide reductase OsmC/OhrA
MASEHKVSIHWKRNTNDFQYDTYDRSHKLKFEGGQEINATSAPEFKGKKEFANPEEMLAAAISSCHMLTFLAIAAKSRTTVDSYEDHAVAILDKNASGKICVTKVLLHPKIKFSGDNVPDATKVRDFHDKAHHNCFIANTVACDVMIAT